MQISELIDNERKIKQFEKRGITTVKELLEFYPRKYEDHRNPVTPLDVQDKDTCTMILHIDNIRNKSTSVIAECTEKKSGKSIKVVWFNMKYMYQKIVNLFNMDVLVSGKYTDGQWGRQFVNPTVFTTDISEHLRIVPVYKNITGMSKDYLDDTIDRALTMERDPDFITEDIRQHFGIVAQEYLFQLIHRPRDERDITAAQNRIIFNELFAFAKEMEERNAGVSTNSPYIPTKLTNCNKLIKALPYDLTNDQKKVIKEVVDKAKRGERINALIQGDVGCGKTITAILLMVAMSDNGYQSVIMAPTGVLARQHYEELSNLVGPFGLKCAYLSSGMKAIERKAALNQIKSGEVQFIVGTHACIGDSVEYNNLGLTVVDEEHKFGVKQREKLKEKANAGVHSISMSATPIPRSLAMSLYSGTLDVYTIRTMPSGRKPVYTYQVTTNEQVFEMLEREIGAGHQGYIVCPQITSEECDVDNEDKEKPESVEEVYEAVARYFTPRGIQVGYITGKAKDNEKSEIIDKFNRNEFQILIATTIIEVGVNVPNATVMAIMSADRFGLAGLHQLRGRVGRSSLQSYCILKSQDEGNPRLQAMCRTTNGFEIAEQDLMLRGTGDFIGTKQSGDNTQVMLMMKYPRLYEEIKKYVHQEDVLQFD